MSEFSFEALGTTWSILTDGDKLKQEDEQALLAFIQEFDQQFSRFLPASEAVSFRDAQKGEYPISEEFAQMLKMGKILQSLTDGVFDPAVGKLLEYSGYDPQYRFTADQEKIQEYQIPAWSVSGTMLSLDGGIVFDIGGIGKGFCIDLVVEFLKSRGYHYFLVDAGGDMFGTSKQDQSPFQIALEWPGRPGIAFGTIALKNQGLAVSDSFRRRWPASAEAGKNGSAWHHIIDPLTKKPVAKVVGCAAVAPDAFQADCMTSGLFLAPEQNYKKLAEQFTSEFVVFLENDQVQISEDWPGKFFE